jgi:hypothetical protein
MRYDSQDFSYIIVRNSLNKIVYKNDNFVCRAIGDTKVLTELIPGQGVCRLSSMQCTVLSSMFECLFLFILLSACVINLLCPLPSLSVCNTVCNNRIAPCPPTALTTVAPTTTPIVSPALSVGAIAAIVVASVAITAVAVILSAITRLDLELYCRFFLFKVFCICVYLARRSRAKFNGKIFFIAA